MTWKHHVDDLIDRTQKTINLMKCFHGMTWGISNKILITLYKSLIRSKIDYGSILYQDASKTTLNRIDSIQYRALRVALAAAKGTSLAALLAETGETSLHIRRQTLCLKHLIKIKSNPDNITNNIFNHKRYPHTQQSNKTKNNEIIQTLLADIKVEIKFTTQESFNSLYPAPWTPPMPNIQIDLTFPDGKQLEKNIDEATFEAALDKNYPNHVQIYVDASKNDTNAIAIFIPSEQIARTYLIPYSLSIFATEAFALLKALELKENMKTEKTIIFSDNLSLLKQLKNPLLTTQTKIKRPILLQTIREKIKPDDIIFWIPGHTKITKHIITDNLTKYSFTNLVYSNIFIELDEIMEIINDKYNNIWFNDWITMRGAKDYSTLHNIQNLNNIHPVQFINRQAEIIANRLRLCCNNLNFYKNKVGKSESPLCVTCLTDETTTHFLTKCINHKILIDKIKKYTKQENLEPFLYVILKDKDLLTTIITYIREKNICF